MPAFSKQDQLRRRRTPKAKASYDEVALRSGGICEQCGKRPAMQMHHEPKRSQGGSGKANELRHVCLWCHLKLHGHRVIES